MFQNVLGSNGRMHLERQFGNQRIDLTTGDTKTVFPGFGGMNTVLDEDGVHTEMLDRGICARRSARTVSTGCCRLDLPQRQDQS